MPVETTISDLIQNETAQREQQQASQQAEPTKEQKLLDEIRQEEEKTLNDFDTAKPYLNELIGKWLLEEQRTEANRLTRDIDIDIDQMRELGDVDDDECFIPVRIIDGNIQREMPSFINFVKNSRRVATFNDILDATFDTQLLEDAFTKVMTYKGWEKVHYKTLDSAMTHGWCCYEVVYDETKPGNVGIEYIPHERLIFPQDSEDFQTASVVLRKYKVTPLQLKTWVFKFGFDIIQVNGIIEKYKEKTAKDKTVTIYKRLCKHNGIVYVSWFSMEGNVTDWLKKPAKLYVGIDELKDVSTTQKMPVPQYDAQGNITGQTTIDVPSTEKQWVKADVVNYPIFLLSYRETEKPLLFDHIGRVFLDKDKQESQTAMLTAFVNGVNRAQKIYASPGADTMADGKPAKQLANIKWANGTIFDKPMEFWNMPYPSFEILKYLEFAGTSNLQDIGQTDFATINREDSRKTAKEISAAQSQQSLLDSVDLTLYSACLREVYSFAWLIVRSQALQNKIKFLQVRQDQLQTPDPIRSQSGQPQQDGIQGVPPTAGLGLNAPMPMQQQAPTLPPAIQSIVDAEGSYQQEQTEYVNDYDTLIRQYDVRAAGDVDVIQKQEIVATMKQDWPVVQTTPLAMRFLSDLIKLTYPQDGAIYSQILQQGNPKNQIIQALGAFIQEIIKEPAVKQQMTPAIQQQLKQLEAEAQQSLATP